MLTPMRDESPMHGPGVRWDEEPLETTGRPDREGVRSSAMNGWIDGLWLRIGNLFLGPG